jgi:DNA-binding CsgD family transcriptional regulator
MNEIKFAPINAQSWRKAWQHKPDIQDDKDLADLLQQYFNPATIFSMGQCFFMVAEVAQSMLIRHIQGDFELMTGYTREPYLDKDLAVIHQILPEEDSPILLGFCQVCHAFLAKVPPEKRNQIKFTFYFNLKHKSGRLVPVIQQDSVYTNAEGIPKYGFSIISDISHLKDKNDLMMSILNLEAEGNQQFVSVSPEQPLLQLPENSVLSMRERQIIARLTEGFASKQIADDLGITFHTVNTHRRNMLAKTGCKNSTELLRYAIDKGLI